MRRLILMSLFVLAVAVPAAMAQDPAEIILVELKTKPKKSWFGVVLQIATTWLI